MNGWFRKIKGVLWLSFIALLSLLARSYVDTAFILAEDYSKFGAGFTVVWVLGFTAISGGWVWALVAAAGGNRKSLTVLLVYALVCALGFGAGSLIAYVSYPIEYLIFGANLVTGAVAATSVFQHLRSVK